jgi:hypothetical protein
MQIKAYIAIFFVCVFLGKFITTDSKLLGFIVDSEEVTLVNPFCKKLQTNTPKELQNFDEASFFSNITVHVICASPFQFETFNEKIAFTAPNYQKHNSQTQPIISTFQDKFYPPPKV